MRSTLHACLFTLALSLAACGPDGAGGAELDTDALVPLDDADTLDQGLGGTAPACILRTVIGPANCKPGTQCIGTTDGTYRVSVTNTCGYTAAVAIMWKNIIGEGTSGCRLIPNRDAISQNLGTRRYSRVRSCVCKNGKCS